MKPEDIVHILPADELFERAAKIFAVQKKELEALLPVVDIQQVGSSAVRGMIGKLDVDIQIRTIPERFHEVVLIMRKNYTAKHPEIWAESFAVFSNNKEGLVDIMVTVTGSKYDDFYKVRDKLESDKELKERYNDLKRPLDGKTYAEYKKMKADFLGPNGMTKFLK